MAGNDDSHNWEITSNNTKAAKKQEKCQKIHNEIAKLQEISKILRQVKYWTQVNENEKFG